MDIRPRADTLMSQNPRSKAMLSKRAGSFVVLVPVLVFAQWYLPSSNSSAAQRASQPRIGMQEPSAHLGLFGPGSRLRRPPFSPWNKMTGQSFVRPRAEWKNRPNPIFLTAPTYGSGGYFAESLAVADVNGDGKPDLV